MTNRTKKQHCRSQRSFAVFLLAGRFFFVRKEGGNLVKEQTVFVHIWPILWGDSIRENQIWWYDWLSEAEKSKAERFSCEADRRRYILSHGYCRSILSRYVHQRPDKIQFAEEKNQKPIIKTDPHLSIHFNLSHSSHVAVVAVSNRPIGVDIEWLDSTLVRKELVDQFMSEQEKEVFFRLSSSRQKKAFYYCWTRKEAYVKALGEGLFYPIKKITVPLNDETNLTWSDEEQPHEPKRWRMDHIGEISGYVGAVVHQGKNVVCKPILKV
mgnify:CR=1 FL=1